MFGVFNVILLDYVFNFVFGKVLVFGGVGYFFV